MTKLISICDYCKGKDKCPEENKKRCSCPSEQWEQYNMPRIGETMKNKDDYEKEIKELITELAIEKQKQISNMKNELQVQTAISDIQYQNAIMQTQLSFR